VLDDEQEFSRTSAAWDRVSLEKRERSRKGAKTAAPLTWPEGNTAADSRRPVVEGSAERRRNERSTAQTQRERSQDRYLRGSQVDIGEEGWGGAISRLKAERIYANDTIRWRRL